MEYSIGDQVQVYIPRGDDPDHRYHGKTGEIINIHQDNLSETTGNPRQDHLYTVKFTDSDLEKTDFRYSDLQTPDQI